jgi:hypothetical protein
MRLARTTLALNNTTAGVREREDTNPAALRQTKIGLIIDALIQKPIMAIPNLLEFGSGGVKIGGHA